jgi:hypothetical protein
MQVNWSSDVDINTVFFLHYSNRTLPKFVNWLKSDKKASFQEYFLDFKRPLKRNSSSTSLARSTFKGSDPDQRMTARTISSDKQSKLTNRSEDVENEEDDDEDEEILETAEDRERIQRLDEEYRWEVLSGVIQDLVVLFAEILKVTNLQYLPSIC